MKAPVWRPALAAAALLSLAGGRDVAAVPPFASVATPPSPTPAATSTTTTSPAPTYVEDAAVVARVMGEEIARSMKELQLGDSPRPYYVAYAVSDAEQAVVTATFGAVTGAYGYRGRTLRTDVRVGSPSFDNTNTSESMFGGSVDALPVDDDPAALRRELWLRTDEAYKNAVETLAKKKSAAAGQTTRQDDDNVPDFSDDKAAKLTAPFPAGSPEPDRLLDSVTRLSGFTSLSSM